MTVPNKQIDEMWHEHILDTRKYSDDCQTVFGYYLHHTPANPKDNQPCDTCQCGCGSCH